MTNGTTVKIGRFIYSENDIIGKGSFGKVYKGKNMDNGNTVGIKVVGMQSDTKQQSLMLRMIKNEVEALKKVKHENIIEFLDCILLNNNVYIITEFCN
mmetsp:Transcript_40612/g.36050  ORF Transcript_40612/g.36050 Transcript_40612/m.36050 type:complete len:98 (+) Transcript_40612:49-342(+)